MQLSYVGRFYQTDNKFLISSDTFSQTKRQIITVPSMGRESRNKKDLKRGLLNSEKEGFEPSRQITPPNTLAGCRLQPLGHFSLASRLIITKAQKIHKSGLEKI